MWFILGAIFLILLLIHIQQERHRSPNCARLKGVPILGLTDLAVKNYNNMLDWLTGVAIAYDRPFQFNILGAPNSICIFTPDNIKYILEENFDNYVKGFYFRDRFSDLLGDGIFGVDGEKWYFQRKTASHIFKRKEMKGFFVDVLTEHGRRAQDMIAGFVERDEEIDIQVLFNKFTLESIAKIAFGVNLGCFENTHVGFATAFDTAQQIIMERTVSPIWDIRRYLKFFHPDERRMTQCLNVLNEFAEKVISERKMEKDLEHRDDLLSLFMNWRGDDDRTLTDVELRDVVMSFVIAGRDTTANCLTWFFSELEDNPDVERKVREEIQTVLQGEEPTYQKVVNEMPYLSGCIKETLRLHPSVPKDIKFAVDSDVLPDGTIVPAGTAMIYLPYTMGRMESLWENPSRFWPERWMEMENEPSAYKFIAFNAGKRICLGKNLAYLETKIAASMILQQFKFIPTPGQRKHYQVSLTLPMLGGYKGKFVPVNK